MQNKSLIEDLQKYKQRIEEWEPFIKGMRFNKEENTMIKFVVPFFEILGWNVFSRDMEFEYFVRKAGLADIALYVKNFDIPKILVEVKPLQDKFKKKYPTKIFSYIRNSKVNYGIAINGKELILIDKFRVKSKYRRGCRLFSLELKDFIKYKDVLRLISRNMVEKDELDKFAREYHHKFFDWRKPRKKTRDSEYNEYVLRLEFARNFLKCSKAL